MTANIALQLYTVRGETSQDMLGTLRRLAEMGYRAVEFAGLGGRAASEVRSTLDDLGLRAVAAHVQLADFENRLPEAISDVKVLGCTFAVLPAVPERYRSVEGATRLLPLFHQWARHCQEEGVRFAYHNHAFEFVPVAGRSMYDVLVEDADPALVAFEVDTGWAEYAKVSAAEVLRRVAGRVPLVHIKDITDRPEFEDAPVGEGIIDWPPILAAAHEAGAEWFIIEQDNPKDPMTDVATSLANLSRLLGNG